MCLAACLLVSCSQEEEAVYGKGNSYAKRTGETSTEYVNLFGRSSQWMVALHVCRYRTTVRRVQLYP